ncbi:MAG: cobalt transporter [Rhodospirillales bacterium]|nr:cobalt transporter [Rhodospirillales bacterium]
MTTVAIPAVRGRSEVLKAAFVAFTLGTTLVFLTGFSHIDNVHNAAHDTRHAMSFPCH